MRSEFLAGLLGMALIARASAQAPIIKSDVELKAEYAQAQKLYDGSNFVAALPLFEDLHSQQLQNIVYEERLAMCLLGTRTGMSPEASKATRARAMSLLQEAQSRGDSSQLLITLLEKLGNEEDGPAAPEGPMTPAHSDFTAAEKHFSSGDLKGALALYQKALDEDPTFYAAALYAGDSLFKLGDCAQAETYYAKAVAIDPDQEQDHRYWGDCLMKQGETAKAGEKYIEAVIAQPYQKTTRQSLDAWAKLAKATIAPPAITLPAKATMGQNGNINITIAMGDKKDPETSMAMMYSMNSALWQGDDFKKKYPNEKVYRHSLQEEVEGINLMIAGLREQKIPEKKLSASTKLLLELQKNGMVECWILLDDADEGIAKDYAAYRKDHRDLMAKYVAQYDVHKM
jgi:tetratricopeptide (TPR) repeat protein